MSYAPPATFTSSQELPPLFEVTEPLVEPNTRPPVPFGGPGLRNSFLACAEAAEENKAAPDMAQMVATIPNRFLDMCYLEHQNVYGDLESS